MQKHRKHPRKGVIYDIGKVVDSVIDNIIDRVNAITPPCPPTNLQVIFKGDNVMSKIANVQLTWTPSVSPNVTSQVLSVTVGSGAPVVTNLAASVAVSSTFEVPEDTSVHVELTAVDDAGSSVAATLDFQIGDLSVPAAPTALAYTIVSVVDATAPSTGGTTGGTTGTTGTSGTAPSGSGDASGTGVAPAASGS